MKILHKCFKYASRLFVTFVNNIQFFHKDKGYKIPNINICIAQGVRQL